MSVSGKTAIGQVVSGVRLIHDEKKVKRMLEAQKREINPDASEELYYFLNAEKRIVNVRFTGKYEKKCTNKSRKEFDFWLIVLLYNDYNIGVTRKNLTKPLC